MSEIKPGLELLDLPTWQNKHENFNNKFTKPRSYKLRNPNKGSGSLSRYKATTENIKFLIGDAISRKLEVKALGRGWSFTKVGLGKNGIVDTLSLRLAFKIGHSQIHDDFTQKGFSEKDLYFIQCGNSVRVINSLLEKQLKEKRSIIASGASNGQTIAGATATGTHGAAFDVGAVHDAIVGLHIVTGPNRHVYIERKSDRVVKNSFANALNVDEHITDDDVFNSAVVGLGSFGIIHGIMLRTEPIFLLEKYITQTSYTAAVKKGFDTLDFSKFPLVPSKHAKGKLYHFQAIINPYKASSSDGGVFLTYMYKRPYGKYKPRTLADRGLTYGDDTLGVLASILKAIPPALNRLAIKTAVNLALKTQFKSNEKYPWIGTMGETFTYTSLKGKTASCAIGVDMTNTIKVVDLVIDHIKNKDPFFGVIALRYVKGTKATIGFTKFPTTCVIELDGADNKSTRDFYIDICKILRKAKIEFTLHWGKINDYLKESPLNKVYSTKKIKTWNKSREIVFKNDKAKKVFENDFVRDVGLI